MYTKYLQHIIFSMFCATKKDIGVLDKNNCILAFSGKEDVETTREVILKNSSKIKDCGKFDKYIYSTLKIDDRDKILIFIEYDDKDKETTKYINIIETLIRNNCYSDYYEQKEENLIKSILMGRLYPDDIYIKARELKINIGVDRVVFLVEFLNDSFKANHLDSLKKLFNIKKGEFIFNIEEKFVAIIKKVDDDFKKQNFVSLAISAVEYMASYFSVNILIGIGKIKKELKDIVASFKEARTCLKIIRIFKTKENIVSFDNIGIARLIYNQPIDVCKLFLNEFLKKERMKKLDEETILTIYSFFENNLNISETARKLFIHRNTLVYRLAKIKNITGLDLTIFEEATKFKLALMVHKYLEFALKEWQTQKAKHKYI